MKRAGLLLIGMVWQMATVLALYPGEGCDGQPLDGLERSYKDNPAAFILLKELKKSDLLFRYRTFGAKSLHSLFDGEGGYFFQAKAEGYQVDTGRSAFSGFAAYERGVDRNVRWTDVRDVELLYPYLLADSLGGDYHSESYKLGGSWSLFHKNVWYGLRGNYRGEVAFRPRDPRPENTVSELTLNPGTLFTLGKWYGGAFFSYTFYKQHVSVRIEEPSRKDQFFILKGMGLYDYLFSTVEDGFSRYYRSHAYRFGLQFGQQGHTGFSGLVKYGRRMMAVEESDNRLPYHVGVHSIHGDLAYRTAFERGELALTSQLEFHRQKGREKSYEQVESDAQTGVTVWRFLTESEKHTLNRTRWNLGALFRHTVSGRLTLWYGAGGEWRQEQERYLQPEYRQQLADLTGNVQFGFRRLFGQKRLEGNWRGAYRKNLSADLTTPPAQVVVNEMLRPEYEFKKSDFFDGRMRLSFTFPLYKAASLAFYSDSRCAYADRDAYRWQTEAGVVLVF